MSKWSRRRNDSFPDFRLSQHKQYLEYAQSGVEYKERERYIRMTTAAIKQHRSVDSTALLDSVLDYNDPRIKEYEKRLIQCNWFTMHNIISEPLGYYCFCQHICEMFGMSSSEFWMEVMSFDAWKVHRHARWIKRKQTGTQKEEQKETVKATNSSRGRMGVLMGLEESDSADSQYNEVLEEQKVKRTTSKWATEECQEGKLQRLGSVLFGAVPDDDMTKGATTMKEGQRSGNYELEHQAKKRPLVEFLISKNYHEAAQASFHQKTTCTEEKSSTNQPSISHCVSDIVDNGPKDIVYRRLSEEEIHNFRNSIHYKIYIRHLYNQHIMVEPEDFKIVKLLGQGGFGKVFCCKKADSGQLYAVKCLSKARIIQKKAISMTKLEKDSMARLRSNFIVGLDFATQDAETLYLVMTLMTGGNLRYHLRREGFGEHLTRFYAAEVLLGLEHMHKLRILYRDLKLDNILLDYRGHCRLSDLGLCGILPVGKQKTRYAGTPGYMAPEIVMRRPYDMSADIWSFGVCVFRMLAGHKPFDGPNRHVLNKNVCAANPTYNAKFGEDSKLLVQALLNKAPASRLSITEIKSHKFFQSIDWQLLAAGAIKPPYVPSQDALHAPTTTELVNMPIDKKQKVKEDKKALKRLEERYRHTFDDWDYVSPAAVQSEMVAALMLHQKKLPDKLQTVPNSCCTII
mmetsp:Transcript_20110/g.28048  ORF Transcript_20110/g.28048 Transcript_20110/m.28048 type:complete len:684 (-) Transcript_20110:528-2579(-)|eukprot:CAMPEP_0184486428 /NCGR_PEP_ID=MMETSP0113_2-20130426/7923_1 /TAXON_ID=91329 /ORGANISM="Norrisiella sphaerica, Strain BC52" /LENGTH=683 /DNA_ID=CAMNT_0026868307 /DNA_START=283 /DNA_END=2334 /DNA_ORIENTATION=+